MASDCVCIAVSSGILGFTACESVVNSSDRPTAEMAAARRRICRRVIPSSSLCAKLNSFSQPLTSDKVGSGGPGERRGVPQSFAAQAHIAAIYRQFRAGDETGVVAAQKEDGARDLAGFPQSPHH